MAIKFIKERSFWWPVTVNIPQSDDLGKGKCSTEPHYFRIKLKDHSTTEYIAALNFSGSKLVDYLSTLITEWEGVLDEDGSPIECNDENKGMFFDVHYVLAGLIEALGKAHKDASIKN